VRGWVGACGSVSRGLHVLACACVCLCGHACLRLECLCARMHVCMSLEDSVALVRMLDSPFAGSVATIVFPWRHCHVLLH